LIAINVALPPVVHAQKSAFVREVGELAKAAAVEQPARGTQIAAIVERMAAALARWDRDIEALETRIAADAGSAATSRIAELRLELGAAYLDRGRHADARRILEAESRHTQAGAVHLLLARARAASGDAAGAARAIAAAWELDRRDPFTAYALVRDVPPDVPADRERAQAALMDAYRSTLAELPRSSGQRFAVPEILADESAQVPVIADRMLARGFAHLLAHQYDDAIAALRQPDDATAPRSVESPLDLFARGRQAELANQIADARRAYESAVDGTLFGRYALYVGIGRLALVDGDAPAGIAAFESAARVHPNNPHIRLELSAALAAEGRTDDAFAELVAVLLIDPRNAQAHAAAGQLFLDTGRPLEAIAAFERTLRLTPERYEIHYALATALARMGRTAEAERERETFERARLDMEDRRRRQIDRDVEADEIRRRQPSTGERK
jgi:tetratricopeptide (TPR) repeat protein